MFKGAVFYLTGGDDTVLGFEKIKVKDIRMRSQRWENATSTTKIKGREVVADIMTVDYDLICEVWVRMGFDPELASISASELESEIIAGIYSYGE